MISSRSGMDRIAMPWDNRTKRRFKIRDLDVLMAVVEAGGIGKAAGRLRVSQPAVSKSISDLEDMFWVRLLERSRQGSKATPYPIALIKPATAIFDQLRTSLQEHPFLSQ